MKAKHILSACAVTALSVISSSYADVYLSEGSLPVEYNFSWSYPDDLGADFWERFVPADGGYAIEVSVGQTGVYNAEDGNHYPSSFRISVEVAGQDVMEEVVEATAADVLSPGSQLSFKMTRKR